jgi:hypothetical protein
MKKSLLLFLVLMLTACSPTATPVLLETTTATPTSIPTAAPTPTPTATLTATPVPGGPCDNPLVPLMTGNQWTYRVTSSSGGSLYNFTAPGRQDGGNIVTLVEYTDQRNNLVILEPVVCQQGVIENYPLFVLNMLFSDQLNKYLDTYHETGVYAPGSETLSQNNWVMDWQADYLTEDNATIANPGGGPSLLLLSSSPLKLSFSMDGTREAVTVPAGDFPQAVKIILDYSMLVSITMPGSNTGTPDRLTLKTSQWFEPYIGLVRARIDSASLSGGYSVPMDSTIELVEFVPGN